MRNLDENKEKRESLTDGGVFTDEIIESFRLGSLDKWKKKLSTRIIDRNIRLLRTFKKLHTVDSMDAIDEVMWDAIEQIDRKSTRLNSSHANISYAVFCLKKKKQQTCQDYSHAN